MNAIERHFPEFQYRRHQKLADDIIDKMLEMMHIYLLDYGSLGRIRKELTSMMSDVPMHYSNTREKGLLVINTADASSFTLKMPKSEESYFAIEKRFRSLQKKLAERSISVSEWADNDCDGRLLHGFSRVLHHIHRTKERPDDVFIADRFAVLRLAKNTERDVSGKTLEELIAMAEERLAEQGNRWSRRTLNMLGVQRTRSLLVGYHENHYQAENILQIKADLPESVKQTKNRKLEQIIQSPGVEALGLTVRKITDVENGKIHLHTDAWDKRMLVEIKPGKRRYGVRS